MSQGCLVHVTGRNQACHPSRTDDYSRRIPMSFQTEFARRVFPRDQTFMARRKLRQMIWAIGAGLLVAGGFAVMIFLVQGKTVSH
jgi:hypothetical protein